MLRNKEENKSFTPKWRHFPVQSTVWLHNPFDDDIVFAVADELNRQFKYRLEAHETSELPGGSIATLGVKKIVDRLIQNSTEDSAQMWNLKTRAKYEKQVIVGFRDAPVLSSNSANGEINLKSKLGNKDVVTTDDVEDEVKEEHPVMPSDVPELPNAPYVLPQDDLESTEGDPELPGRIPAFDEEEAPVKDEESRLAAASHVRLPAEDAIIE